MYAVIFKARIKQLDKQYTVTAKRMRELAINHYGCLSFSSYTEGNEEIAISYWSNEADIVKWKQDPEHIAAQEMGRNCWYISYSVEVTEIIRRYQQDL